MSFFRSTKPTNRPQPNFDSERAQNIAAQAMRHIMNEEEDSTSSGATHQPAKPKPVVPDLMICCRDLNRSMVIHPNPILSSRLLTDRLT